MKWLLLVAAVLSACTDDVVVEPGIVGSTFMNPDVPSSARIGESFTVKVTTEGGGCRSIDSTDVVIMGDVAIVTPYDRYRTTGTCTLELRAISHEATVSFDTRGQKTVRIIARSPQLADIEIERQVVVQ